MGETHHVIRHEEQWAVIAGASKEPLFCDDRESALLLATCLAATDDGEVVVHDRDGLVQQRFMTDMLPRQRLVA